MSNYIEIVKQSFMFFPLVAFLLTFPYVLINYHKYGSVFSLRVLIVYSLVLYLLTVYFLVILPLPDLEVVEAMSGPKCQLIPFYFIVDWIKEIKDTGKAFYLCQALYQVLFNVLMTFPFGIYLHYYFKCNFKKTLLLSFLLSLFFELTQLSGLYFIYPRPYRLFDIDDLIANTLGGVFGYYAAIPIAKILPDRDEIDQRAKELGKKVSLLKRLTAMGIDFVFFVIVSTIVSLILENKGLSNVRYITPCFVVCYLLVPLLLKGRTIGQWTVKTKYADKSNGFSPIGILIMFVTEVFIFIGFPLVLGGLCDFLLANIIDKQYQIILKAIIFFIYLSFVGIEVLLLLLNKRSLAQRVAGLKIVSTIK